MFCMTKIENKTLGAKGYDAKENVFGEKCVDCMSKRERKAYFNMNSQSGPSAVFTGDLLEQFQKMDSDPNFTAIKQNGIIANIRLMQLLSLLDEKAPPTEIWKQLKDTWIYFEEATAKVASLTRQARIEQQKFRAIDPNTQSQLDDAQSRQKKYLTSIGTAISDGVDVSRIWDEALEVNEQVAQLKERETRRRQMIGAMMEPDEIAEFFGFLRGSIENGIDEDLNRLRDEGILPNDTPLDIIKSMLLRSIGGRIQTQIQRIERGMPEVVLNEKEFRSSLLTDRTTPDNISKPKDDE